MATPPNLGRRVRADSTAVAALSFALVAVVCPVVNVVVAFSPPNTVGLSTATIAHTFHSPQAHPLIPGIRQRIGRGPYVVALPATTGDDTDEAGSYDPQAGELTETEIASAANDLVSLTGGGSIDLPDEISQSFMQYAMSIILGRALPDARDGLKPVHRRILYAMSGLGLGPSTSHRKCARVVGEVLGKYHPHGDVAVYDALVRLAQDFSTGTPLIDGHGNFGSIDNDPAAAMRYTECKLTKVSSVALLDDLGSDTVDFVPNFDGNEMEPSVLPAKLPVLLLNGCAGIAVGMATNVPPHNLNELMDACIALTAATEDGATAMTDTELFKLIPGPDFPTAAVIIGTEGCKKLYETGNGGVVIRAVTQVEQIVPRGLKGGRARTAIVVTELPYQVNKAALLEKIADLVNDKKLEGVADLRDESDRDGIRVVIELKKDAVAAVVQVSTVTALLRFLFAFHEKKIIFVFLILHGLQS